MSRLQSTSLLQRLNFHHLYYFWMTVQEGSISRAAERLRLSQPTVSSQLKSLEHSLGFALLERRGRSMAPTEAGRLTFRYADDIFGLGQELLEELRGEGSGHVNRLRVGVAMVVPKLLVHRLLAPVQKLDRPPALVLTEDLPDRLMGDLAIHDVDVILSDAPIPPGASIRAFNHLLGECSVSVFAAPALLERHRGDFPGCLHGAPLLLPTAHAAIRAPLERWFTARSIDPEVISEFQNSALMKVYGQEGAGFFVAPSVIEEEVCARHGVSLVGRTGVRDRFYAITLERRIRNPTIALLAGSAHDNIFSEQ